MPFWTDGLADGGDPRRNFRFKIISTSQGPNSVFNGLATNGCWWAKKVTQPKPTIGESKHSFLAHDYYWPARVKWSDVDVTMVDPINPINMQKQLVQAFQSTGGAVPTENNWRTIGKFQANAALGDLQIQGIDENGLAISTWTLKHSWIKEIGFTDYDYENENLMELTLKIKYDWAEFLDNQGNTTYLGPQSQ
jgi:hypothetical protein